MFYCLSYFNYLLSLFFITIFFFNDTATTEIYTLSLHDALPICLVSSFETENLHLFNNLRKCFDFIENSFWLKFSSRSEEHTSELQSRLHLVCRLLLEKKKQANDRQHIRKIKEDIRIKMNIYG